MPIYTDDFDLLSFKIGSYFFIDKCLPMSYSESCSFFEKFSTFVKWVIMKESESKNIDHYLDDFFICWRK